MPLGSWMRETRLAKHLTAAECAERAGMLAPVWSNWENGRSRRRDGQPSQPRRETVEAVARALDVPISEALHAAYGNNEAADQDEWTLIYDRVPPSRRAGFVRAVQTIADLYQTA